MGRGCFSLSGRSLFLGGGFSGFIDFVSFPYTDLVIQHLPVQRFGSALLGSFFISRGSPWCSIWCSRRSVSVPWLCSFHTKQGAFDLGLGIGAAGAYIIRASCSML